MTIIASLLVGIPYNGPLLAPLFRTLCSACPSPHTSGAGDQSQAVRLSVLALPPLPPQAARVAAGARPIPI